MSMEKGLTVEEVIELLKQHNPKKRVVIGLMTLIASDIKEIKTTTFNDKNGAESVVIIEPVDRLSIQKVAN